MNTVNKNKVEYLSEDLLDEGFIRIFKLSTSIQMVLGSCRVHIKDRFVSSPSVYQKVYTVLCIILNTIVYFTSTQPYFICKFTEYTIISFLLSSLFVLDLIAHISNMIHVRFIIGEVSSRLYIKLHHINRLMKINLNTYTYTVLHRSNIITVTFLIITYLSVLVALIKEIGLITFFFSILLRHLTFMLEIADCSNIIVHLFIHIRYLNSIVGNYLVPKTPIKNKERFLSKKKMRYLAAKFNNFEFDDTDVYLEKIFDCFSTFHNAYRFEMFLFCTRLVVLNLAVFEFTLLAIQRNLLKPVELIFVATYYMIYFITTLILSTRLELLFREVKETKRLSITVMIRYQEGPLREKARRMLKLLTESPLCFSVYEIWYMDAETFVRIFNLISSLILTLLQFEFL